VDEHQSFFKDDDDDTLLFEKLREHVLEKYPNPERIGCFDHSTLETLVYSPEKLDLSDPGYIHVMKCAECTRELLELRKLRNEQSERPQVGIPPHPRAAANRRWAGLAAVLVCWLTLAGAIYWRTHSVAAPPASISATPLAETIDLSEAGTTRGGEASTVPPVILPRRVVAAHIILPNFSPGGNYVVSVTTDRNGTPGRAAGRAIASVHGFHTDLTVTLDLRNLPLGTYYLSTSREGDQASYYYPLTMR
jgi:hypothetical protein